MYTLNLLIFAFLELIFVSIKDGNGGDKVEKVIKVERESKYGKIGGKKDET